MTNPEGEFSTELDFPLPERTVDTPFHFLVMEAMRLLDHGEIDLGTPAVEPLPMTDDEAARDRFDLSSLQQVPGFVAAGLMAMPDKTLLNYLGDQTFKNVCGDYADILTTKQSVLDGFGDEEIIEEIIFTLNSHVHIIHPIRRGRDWFVYVTFARTRSNLGIARHIIRVLEQRPEYNT